VVPDTEVLCRTLIAQQYLTRKRKKKINDLNSSIIFHVFYSRDVDFLFLLFFIANRVINGRIIDKLHDPSPIRRISNIYIYLLIHCILTKSRKMKNEAFFLSMFVGAMEPRIRIILFKNKLHIS